MKRPSQQAKLVLLGLLKTASALASSTSRVASSPSMFSTLATSASVLRPFKAPTSYIEEPLVRKRKAAERVVQLRAAHRSDVPSLAHCNEQTLPENYHSRWYHQHLADWPDLAFVVVENTRVVAYLLGKTHDQPPSGISITPSLLGGKLQDQVGHVSSLAVLPEFRRQGLASELLDVFHMSIERRCNYASLHCRQSNAAAVRLYEAAGYHAAYSIRNYYEDGEDAYYMKKLFRKRAPFLGRMRYKVQLGLPRTIILSDGESSAGTQSMRDEGDTPTPELFVGTL